MFEIEVKAKADLSKAKNKLQELGAEKIGTKDQKDIYYTAPHRDFKKTDEALRIRKENHKVYLTYKGPKIDNKSKTRKEIEFEVPDQQKADSFLESLGFKKSKSVSKKRYLYSMGKYKIALDKVENLGEFIEVETHAERDKLDEKRDKTLSILRKLTQSEIIRDSYLEMLDV